jgi:hypothetical protein
MRDYTGSFLSLVLLAKGCKGPCNSTGGVDTVKRGGRAFKKLVRKYHHHLTYTRKWPSSVYVHFLAALSSCLDSRHHVLQHKSYED